MNSKNNITFSILTTVYNSDIFLKEYLVNIEELNNNFFNQLEIIIVDDYSNDNTYAFLEKYTNNIDNIYIYKNNNKGRSFALNYALKKARNDYIIILDIDDFLSVSYIDELCHALEKVKENIFIFAECNYIKEHKYISSNKNTDQYDLLTKFNTSTLFYNNPIVHSGVCYSKSKITYNDSLKMCVDLDYYLRLRDEQFNFYKFKHKMYNYHYLNHVSSFKKISADKYYEAMSFIYTSHAKSISQYLLAGFSLFKLRIRRMM